MAHLSKARATILVFLCGLSVVSVAEASSIPIPRLNGSVDYDQFVPRWFLLSMAMSISVEGAILSYARATPWPFTASLVSNIVSLLVVDIGGIPVSMAFGSLAWIAYVLCLVLLYGVVEHATIQCLRTRNVGQPFWEARLLTTVVLANAVSTGIMAVWVALKTAW